MEPQDCVEVVKNTQWHKATLKDFMALEANKIWMVENHPPVNSSIDCEWVDKVYKNGTG